MRIRAALSSIVLLSFAVPSLAYRMSVWVPAWDTRALTSMQSNAGSLDEANPVWYEIAAGGGFTKVYNSEAADMRAALTGVDLIPTIQNYVGGSFDGNLVATILASPATREAHAEALAQLVVQNAFDGIDIDYEHMGSAARADFTAFIQLLASKLHASNKKLSVCVDAKTSDSDNWNGPAAEDWRALGAAADSIKIMGYDYHWSTSAAGPISPLDWLDQVATYAESTMPSQKIVMGLPWYGYDWLGSNGADVMYTDAVALAQSMNAPIAHDANGEATFSYNGHTVYFQDATSYAKKTSALVAKHPSIGGFAHWRAGGEDPAIWTTVASLHGGSAAQPSPASFVAAGPTGFSVKAGHEEQASYAITPVNGWSGAAAVSVRQVDTFPGGVTISQTASTTSPAVLVVTPSANAKAGDYRLVVTMTSGTISSTVNVTVSVQAAPPAGKRRIARS